MMEPYGGSVPSLTDHRKGIAGIIIIIMFVLVFGMCISSMVFLFPANKSSLSSVSTIEGKK